LLCNPALAAAPGCSTARSGGNHANHVPESANIIVKHITGNFRRLGEKVLVSYPHFTGADATTCHRLNALVQRAMNENAYEDLIEMKFSKTFVDANSVSTGFKYVRRGGVHSNGFYVPLNYRLHPRIEKMSVEQFFGKKIDIEKLSSVCAKPIAKAMSGTAARESDFYQNLITTDRPFDDFVFDRDKVTFTFCGLGSCAFGVQSFDIPYKEIRGLFAKSSPVFKYVCHSTR
jgi:hypothetical protein